MNTTTAATMKRWVLPADGSSPDDLRLDDAPVPQPGPGEVRVRVRAVSINGRDQMIIGGPFGRLEGRDLVPLSDVAGTVEAVGVGVQEFAVGDAVTNLHFASWADGPPPAEGTGLGLGALDEDGVLAEQVVLPAARLTRAPANLDHAEAATLPVAAVTAWNALFGDHPVQAGQRVLTIASGGVALFALQLARAAGAEVHAVARDASRGEQLRALGAASFAAINGGEWGADVFARTGGAHTVVDTIGPGALTDTMAAVAPAGEVAVVGLFDLNAALDPQALLAKQARVRGVAVGNHQMHRDLVAFVEKHDLHPVIDRRFTFGDAPAAFRHHADGSLFGKILIEVN